MIRVSATSRRGVALLTMLAVLSACRPRTDRASSAESHAPGTTTATVPADCAMYPPGAPGVVRTVCDGPAKVTVTVAGVTRSLSGGLCSRSADAFRLELGVVAGAGLAGPRPDYVGVTVAGGDGPFRDAVIAVSIGGRSYALARNDGEITPTGGRFSGRAIDGGAAVEGAFTC